MLDAIIVDPVSRTIRPANDEAEEFFGLAPLTNGTAASCRRALVQPAGYQWRRLSGHWPRSLCYAVPAGVQRTGFEP